MHLIEVKLIDNIGRMSINILYINVMNSAPIYPSITDFKLKNIKIKISENIIQDLP